MDGRGEECGGNPDPPGSPHSRVWGGVGIVGLGDGLEILVELGEFSGLFSCFVSSFESLSGVGLGVNKLLKGVRLAFTGREGAIEDSTLENTWALAVRREIRGILEKIRV